MAKKNETMVGYEVTITTNPNFAGVGAGGVQFSYGKARITGGRMVDWFREHDGYSVKEITETKGDPGKD